jgi:MEDS: MEthanogen/methylotroph, DcmR Sensory domain
MNRQLKPQKARSTWFSRPADDHCVHFYQSDKELTDSLSEYIGSGLSGGETCIVVARPHTVIALNKRLRGQAADIEKAITDGQYMTYDAQEMLDRFMRRGQPDKQAFRDSVGRVLSRAIDRGQPVRVYGEMVSVLLDQHNAAGLMELEKYWNKLIKDYGFSLYCAYPQNSFTGKSQSLYAEVLESIHGSHAQTLLSL